MPTIQAGSYPQGQNPYQQQRNQSGQGTPPPKAGGSDQGLGGPRFAGSSLASSTPGAAQGGNLGASTPGVWNGMGSGMNAASNLPMQGLSAAGSAYTAGGGDTSPGGGPGASGGGNMSGYATGSQGDAGWNQYVENYDRNNPLFGGQNQSYSYSAGSDGNQPLSMTPRFGGSDRPGFSEYGGAGYPTGNSGPNPGNPYARTLGGMTPQGLSKYGPAPYTMGPGQYAGENVADFLKYSGLGDKLGIFGGGFGAGQGTGGIGTWQTPPRDQLGNYTNPANVPQIQMPDTTAADQAQFNRAKDTIGQTTAGALTGLRSALAGRGLLGGGSESMGTQNILTAGQGQLGQTSRDIAIENARKNLAVAQQMYQGGIAQRGQDIGADTARRGQDVQFDIGERGQDIGAEEARQNEQLLQYQRQLEQMRFALGGLQAAGNIAKDFSY